MRITLEKRRTLATRRCQINIMKEKHLIMKLRNGSNTKRSSCWGLRNRYLIVSNRRFINSIRIDPIKKSRRCMCIWLLILIWSQAGRRRWNSIIREPIKGLTSPMLRSSSRGATPLLWRTLKEELLSLRSSTSTCGIRGRTRRSRKESRSLSVKAESSSLMEAGQPVMKQALTTKT